MSKNLRPHNNKGQRHGVWQTYFNNGKLEYKGNYVNGSQHGLCEHYYDNGQLQSKGNYVNGQPHGYWEIYHNGGVYYIGYYNMGKRVNYKVPIDTPPKDMFPIF